MCVSGCLYVGLMFGTVCLRKEHITAPIQTVFVCACVCGGGGVGGCGCGGTVGMLG